MATKNQQNSSQQDSSTWPVVVLTILVVFMLSGIAIPSCPHGFPHSRRVTKSETNLLKQATESFRTYFGHPIPGKSADEIRKHLLAIDPAFDFKGLNIDEYLQLDDAERLVFWLGGDFPHSSEKHDHPIFIDFEKDRLVDRDGDGYWEYQAELNGLIFEFDAETKRISCDFSDDNLTIEINRETTDDDINSRSTK